MYNTSTLVRQMITSQLTCFDQGVFGLPRRLMSDSHVEGELYSGQFHCIKTQHGTA
ncbi:hypothetical protein [Serratia symbiotica]|uniref:hypothetical protein n=1 Tax=Serratia symbiotica TaxID=138074 RepID=UPI003EB88C1E